MDILEAELCVHQAFERVFLLNQRSHSRSWRRVFVLLLFLRYPFASGV